MLSILVAILSLSDMLLVVRGVELISTRGMVAVIDDGVIPARFDFICVRLTSKVVATIR